ncbi:MAG: hypothetical protein JWQ23_1853, partial [Herminiimonas sp.]|nr:hypothetical protein [Herminiimonas sp.]
TLVDSIGNLPRSAKEHINVMKQISKVERLIRDAGKKLNDPYCAKFANTMRKAAADMEKPCDFLSARYSPLTMDGQERSNHIISLAIAIFKKIGGLAVKGARFQSAEPLLSTKYRPIKLDASPSPNDSQAQRILAHRQSRRDIASSNIESVRNADQGTARAVRPAAPLLPAASPVATAAGSQYKAPLPALPRRTRLTATDTVPETVLPRISPGGIPQPNLLPIGGFQRRLATDSVNAAKGNVRDPLPTFASGRKTSSVHLKETGDPENDASGSSPGEANNLDAMLHQSLKIVDAKLRKASDAGSKFVSARKTSGEQSEEERASGTDASSHSDTEKLNALLDELKMLGEPEKSE